MIVIFVATPTSTPFAASVDAWLVDAVALNRQNISTVKMATSEPVKQTRECWNFRSMSTGIWAAFETILKFCFLEMSRNIFLNNVFFRFQMSVCVDLALAWLALGWVRHCLTLLAGRDRMDIVHSNFSHWYLLGVLTLE